LAPPVKLTSHAKNLRKIAAPFLGADERYSAEGMTQDQPLLAVARFDRWNFCNVYVHTQK
jgi:hypothetical protein